MVNNFSEYWKKNEELYSSLGVTEVAAKKIWGDAVDTVTYYIMEAQLKEFQESDLIES
tara:strand:- start:782 stop:955 length:174 start_codon:yes stop_codon:yes gene_type:complete